MMLISCVFLGRGIINPVGNRRLTVLIDSTLLSLTARQYWTASWSYEFVVWGWRVSVMGVWIYCGTDGALDGASSAYRTNRREIQCGNTEGDVTRLSSGTP